MSRVKDLEDSALERTWWVRIIFGLLALQTFLGPDAVAAFLRGLFGAP